MILQPLFCSSLRRWTPGLVACALVALTVTAFAGQQPAAGHAPAKPPTPTTGAPNPRVDMVIAKRGTIEIELFPQAAPKTVTHFLDLVNKKFYDGILFHRVIGGFVAQAGDPKSKKVDGSKLSGISDQDVARIYGLGAGGSGKSVPLEAKLPHERGTVGLARSNDPDSGDSQFFFNLVANHALDDGYCVFGKVIKGMDVMDKIQQGDRITSVRVVGGKGGTSGRKPGKTKK